MVCLCDTYSGLSLAAQPPAPIHVAASGKELRRALAVGGGAFLHRELMYAYNTYSCHRAVCFSGRSMATARTRTLW